MAVISNLPFFCNSPTSDPAGNDPIDNPDLEDGEIEDDDDEEIPQNETDKPDKTEQTQPNPAAPLEAKTDAHRKRRHSTDRKSEKHLTEAEKSVRYLHKLERAERERRERIRKEQLEKNNGLFFYFLYFSPNDFSVNRKRLPYMTFP